MLLMRDQSFIETFSNIKDTLPTLVDNSLASFVIRESPVYVKYCTFKKYNKMKQTLKLSVEVAFYSFCLHINFTEA